MNAAGAISGMLTGLLFTLSYIVTRETVEPFFPTRPRLGCRTPGRHRSRRHGAQLRRSPLGAVTAPPSPATQALVENLRIPRGADQAKAH